MSRWFSLVLLLVVFLVGSALAIPGRFAYVLRLDDDGKDYLVKFDVTKDEKIEEILLPQDSGFNNFVVDEQGGCYIAEYRNSWNYGHNIYYYNPFKRKIELFAKLGDIYGPRYMVLTSNQLIVEVRGCKDKGLHSGIVFIDRKTAKIVKTIFLRENEPRFAQANINDICWDGKDLLVLSSFYVLRGPDKQMIHKKTGAGDIYVIDIEKSELVKVIDLGLKYLIVDGVCVVGDKVYVAALSKGERKLNGEAEMNSDLLVFSISQGKLIKKLPVTKRPFKLTYDASVSKIYIQHMDDDESRDTIEIIDPKLDKVIGTIKITSRLMFSVVKPGKMYISVGDMFLTPTRTSPALLVFNTKTDKVIKTFNGNYKGISVNNTF